MRDDVRLALADYFRCVDEPAEAGLLLLSGEPEKVSFAQPFCGLSLPDKLRSCGNEVFDCLWEMSDTQLPFKIAGVIEQLRSEGYVNASLTGDWAERQRLRDAYYTIRRCLPRFVRRGLQRLYFHNWRKRSFPHWPVDTTVDELFEIALLWELQTGRVKEIPFIWFWPAGHATCITLTHDVETRAGYQYCSALMDLDEQAGIRSSFQLIPEQRYLIASELLSEIRQRGFEVNIHDFNHDGRLFSNRSIFLARAEKINRWARAIGAKGFRSGMLYRNQEWFDAFEFEFDMSVPNVGHLEVQHGGCCSVMPYFAGKLLELPLTTIQDYSLFAILKRYSVELWKLQAELIRRRYGLISFLVHPDYVREPRACATYGELLKLINHLRSTENAWVALPGEINRWWRLRAKMRVVRNGSSFRIEGPGKEHARLAFAKLEGGQLVYKIEEKAQGNVLSVALSADNAC